ncbi:MFS transporter [Kitasatospora sp. NPDC048365]|uniref:MFS transporter n=1 Tax=Kitasatospora sp. NPDC048365 TaxID=3364050 RepID=UPI0037142497
MSDDRHARGFRRLWAGQSISQFGDRISELALPLIAVGALDASVTEVSALTAMVWGPNLLAVFLGAWVDQRRSKRRLMVVADLVRAAALLTVPAAALAGALTLVQLYAVAVVTGAAGVLFNTAYPSYFAELVPQSAYITANSRLSASRSASFVAGPAVGGGLVQLLTAPFAVLVDAVSFVGSAVLIGRTAVEEAEPGPAGPSMPARARLGLAFIVRHPVLRASLGTCTTVNLFTFVGYSLTVLLASRILGLSAGAIGLAFGVGATGSLLAALVAPAVSRRLGVGPTIALGAVLFPASMALTAVAGGPFWARTGALAAAQFLGGIGVMWFDINLNSLQASVIPDDMRSRVSGAFNTVNYGIRPLGALLGGVLGTTLGVRTALMVAAVGGTLCVLWLLPSPILRIRSLDDVAKPVAPEPAPAPVG